MNQFTRTTLIILTCVALCYGPHLVTRAQQAKEPSLEQRVKLDEQVCETSLRTINTAQAIYREGHDTKGFARSLNELGPAGAGILAATIVSGKKDGYRFQIIPERTRHNQPVRHYVVRARPMKRLTKNQRSFFTDETGVIRSTTENRAATKLDPPLEAQSHR